MKWLWWLGIALALWWWLRLAASDRRSHEQASELPTGAHGPRPGRRGRRQGLHVQGPTVVVPCALCGTHVPRAEAIESPVGDQHFCCEAHRAEWLHHHGVS